MKIRPDNQKAFTLIEMILAIGVAAIVLISANAAFFAAMNRHSDATAMVDEASPVDSAVTFLKRDLECCVTPTNGTTKLLSGGFRAGNQLMSAGVSDPVAVEMYTTTGALSSSQPWGEIQRVTYELKNPAAASASGNGKDLYRSVLRNMLTSSTPTVEEQFMLGGVANIKFSCYDGAAWQDTWDTTSLTAVNTNLPLAVKVDIQMSGSASSQPVEIVVPLDAVVRTNMVLTTTGT